MGVGKILKKGFESDIKNTKNPNIKIFCTIKVYKLKTLLILLLKTKNK